MSEEFNKKDILSDFEYELNKLCQSCIGTVTEIQIKQRPLISLFHQLVWFYEKEKEITKNAICFLKYYNNDFNKMSDNEIEQILYNFGKCADINKEE